MTASHLLAMWQGVIIITKFGEFLHNHSGAHGMTDEHTDIKVHSFETLPPVQRCVAVCESFISKASNSEPPFLGIGFLSD